MSAREKSTAVVAVDTGGTFTDLLLLTEGRLTPLKVPSTPDDPARAVIDGIRRLIDGAPFFLIHGSTVATNALLEGRGARVVLVTNRGFEDIIEIGRQNRPQLYALVGHRPPPLVAREDRIGIRGRLGPTGEEIEPLDEDELRALPAQTSHAESIAICLLHSYANPEHELAAARALQARGLRLSVSSRLLPEYREYERVSTTVVNAYVAPLVARYLGRLQAAAGAERIRVMGSNGGAFPISRAIAEPVHTVLSGPAGGVVGALAVARRAGIQSVISFDMGGTSTDVSLCPGGPLHTREFTIAGQPVAVPVIDIHTVGAGGGSIARVDPGGALRVGPRSAGADPGPICYARGGTQLTVTDAHVWLGRIPVDAFLGGAVPLDRNAIQGPLERLARRLDATPEQAAEGILAVANTAMEGALRVISVERGYDPADFTIVAFGGAAPLHVAELAARLGASRALVPPHPGLLSAYGMLAADVSREVSRTVLICGDDAGRQAVAEIFRHLDEDAVGKMAEEGCNPAALTIHRFVDVRYRGQSFELRISADRWIERFHEAHRERYGYARSDRPVEAVTLRSLAVAPGPRLEAEPLPDADRAPPLEPTVVHVGDAEVEAERVWRSELRAGHSLEGPALVLEYSATTWVPPAWRLEMDGWGNLLLTLVAIPDPAT
ncbi:MAG: hydantoinase/oxoprolinase family protein [Gemmatimonadetes bacterium]|nr:hydantoinase/oxoprolinase family protein [Gemmatimonadota bacterium]